MKLLNAPFLNACFVQYLLQGAARREHREAITRILTRGETNAAQRRDNTDGNS
jgi:hypothetical protein